jgi:hypothetical protein
MNIHTSSPSPIRNHRMLPPSVGTATPSLPRRCREIPAPPPSPAGALRFMGADIADRAVTCLSFRRAAGGRTTTLPAGVVTTLGTRRERAGQFGPSRLKPTVGWAAMAFWSGRCNRPPDHRGLDHGPYLTQHPVISFFNFNSFKYSQKISSNFKIRTNLYSIQKNTKNYESS